MPAKIKLGGIKQRVAALIIGIAVLVYAVYHITSLFGEDMDTIATGVSHESRVVDGKGYIFRDETVLYSEYTGVADYLKADGSKVSIGEELAKVYEQGSDTAKRLLSYYDDRIEILEQSVNASASLSELPSVNDDIDDAYYSLAKLLATGESGEIGAQSDKLLLALNRHSILTDERSPVADTLTRMSAQRSAILAGGGESVLEVSEDSGYFYSYVDGFEDKFTTAAADNLTLESYKELMGTGLSENTAALKTAYGKLADSSEWRFVMRMGGVQSGYFEAGKKYTLKFVENGNTLIPMELGTVIEDDGYGGKILVFFADRLPSGFVFDRCQSVSIEVSSVAGIYVPRAAVHRKGGEYYVYVLKGSVVKMRKLDVIYEGSDYFLSKEDAKSEGSVPCLSTNELLIINGENLFDGRILD